MTNFTDRVEQEALLDSAHDSDDDFILKPESSNNTGGVSYSSANNAIQQVKSQVDDVIISMKDNVTKVMERDVRLSNLNDRSDHLVTQSDQFLSSSARLSRKMWWQKTRMQIIIFVVIGIIILIIVVAVVSKTKKTDGS